MAAIIAEYGYYVWWYKYHPAEKMVVNATVLKILQTYRAYRILRSSTDTRAITPNLPCIIWLVLLIADKTLSPGARHALAADDSRTGNLNQRISFRVSEASSGTKTSTYANSCLTRASKTTDVIES